MDVRARGQMGPPRSKLSYRIHTITMTLSPGLRLLASSLPRLIGPLCVVYLLSLVITLSTYQIATLYVLASPTYIFTAHWRYLWARHLEMRSLGAQEIPTWTGNWPLNFDLLLKLYNQWMTGYVGDGLDDATDKLGLTFKTRFFAIDQVWTSDYRNIKCILVSDFEGYHKGPRFDNTVGSVLGKGVFNSDGNLWKFHRSITRPYFSKERISDFDIFSKYADKVIGLMKSRVQDGFPVDFQDAMLRFTLDSASEFLFGTPIDSLSAGLLYPASSPQAQKRLPHSSDMFSKAFASAQHTIGGRGWNGPSWPLLEMFEDATRKDVKIIHNFLDPILQSATSQHSGDPNQSTFLNHLVSETEDPALLRDELLNILVAARDTSASVMTFALYALSQHPTVLARLRKEILNRIGSRYPTFDDIKEMKYLQAFINETLRLFPPVPFNVRETTRATTWPPNKDGDKPFYLPKGMSICYSVFFLHRNKDLWGTDALEFDPDRFLDERLQKYLIPNPSIFLPFNAGPRLCLGKQFAYNETSFMLIRFLQSFEAVALCPEAQPEGSCPPKEWSSSENVAMGKRKAIEKFFPKTHMTMYAHGGLWLTLGEASDTEP